MEKKLLHFLGFIIPFIVYSSANAQLVVVPCTGAQITKVNSKKQPLHPHAYNLVFDQKGQLHGNLPQNFFPDDQLSFYVGGKDLAQEQQKLFFQKAKVALEHLHVIQDDKNLTKILQMVYGLSAGDLADLEADYKKLIAPNPAKPNDTALYIPRIPLQATYYYTVSSDDINPSVQIPLNANIACGCGASWKPIYPDQNTINILLTRINLYNKRVNEWLDRTKDMLVPVTADRITRLNALDTHLQTNLNELTTIMTKVNAKDTAGISNAQVTKLIADDANLNTKIENEVNLNRSVGGVNDNLRNWMKYWFWYQRSPMPSLNPFPFFQDQDIVPDTSHLMALRSKIAFYQNALKNGSSSSSSLTDDQVTKDVKKIDSCNTAIQAQLSSFQNATALKATNKKLIDSFATTASVLNREIFVVSGTKKDDPIFWMRHHNAANHSEEMNFTPEKEYVESDHVVILTHNLTHSQQASVSLAYQPVVVDESQLGDLLNNSINLYNTSQTAATTGGGLNFELYSWKGNVPTRVIAHAHSDQLTASNIKKIQADIKNLMSLDRVIKYVVKQKNPEVAIQTITDTAAVYHAQKELTPSVISSQLAKYTVGVTQAPASSSANPTAPNSASAKGAPANALTITATATTTAVPVTTAAGATSKPNPVDTFRYRVNKLYRIYPMAGFAFTLNNFISVASNSAGTAPGLATSQPQSHYIGGLKVFFEKTDIRNTSFMWEDDEHGNPLFWTRTHFDLAVDLGTPLNNIYTGFGLDPIPGAAFNFGVVWNRYNYYQYSGGQQIINRSLYRPGFYIGLSTDAAVVAQIIKLFK